MVEGARLESVCAGNRTESSNLFLSAKIIHPACWSDVLFCGEICAHGFCYSKTKREFGVAPRKKQSAVGILFSSKRSRLKPLSLPLRHVATAYCTVSEVLFGW